MNHPTPDERQEAWAKEAEVRPRTEATLDQILRHTENPTIVKLAAQYRRGLLTADELEVKIREALEARRCDRCDGQHPTEDCPYPGPTPLLGRLMGGLSR